jgi:hypothetical protein
LQSHIDTTSFSAVSSQSINDVFSATYKNYLLLLNFTPTTNTTLGIRLRASGSDLSTSHYSNAIRSVSQASTSAGEAGNTNQTRATFGNIGGTYRHHLRLEFFEPFATEFFAATLQANRGVDTGAGHEKSFYGGFQYEQTTSATGVTFIVDAGTITGQISIYGFGV